MLSARGFLDPAITVRDRPPANVNRPAHRPQRRGATMPAHPSSKQSHRRHSRLPRTLTPDAHLLQRQIWGSEFPTDQGESCARVQSQRGIDLAIDYRRFELPGGYRPRELWRAVQLRPDRRHGSAAAEQVRSQLRADRIHFDHYGTSSSQRRSLAQPSAPATTAGSGRTAPAAKWRRCS